MEFNLVLLIFSISGLLISLVITRLRLGYSLKRSILDVPNERSSHSVPTPTGGGISIALVTLLGIAVTFYIGAVAFNEFICVSTSLILIASVGWVDDHIDLPFYWRFVFYSIAVAIVIVVFGGIGKISLGNVVFELSVTASVIITFLGFVWLINLYNFMDGTDGLAALQAITSSLFAFFLAITQQSPGTSLLTLTVCVSSLGFLAWNWPPARIFMGDVGSCVLGFMFALLILLGEQQATIPASVWCILLSFFLCDATFTLCRRLVFREKWHQAHSSHAYQLLIKLGMTHQQLALTFIAINVIFLWPMAYFAYMKPDWTLAISMANILIMLLLWFAVQYQYYKKSFKKEASSA